MQVISEKEFLSGKKDSKIKEFLEGNGIVIFPSESSYGLAGNALSKEVCEKIHSVKIEGEEKPIGVITDKFEKIKYFLEINKKGRRLLETIFSSPLTILFCTKKKVPCTSNDFVGVRIPLNNTALKLCSLVGFPLTAPSANIHGSKAIFFSEKVLEVFRKEDFLLIDAGKLKETLPSTYYNFETREILREGKITKKEIEKVLI